MHPRPNLPALAVACALSSSFIGACASPTTRPGEPEALEPIDLVVLHTNDNWGEVEPCG